MNRYSIISLITVIFLLQGCDGTKTLTQPASPIIPKIVEETELKSYQEKHRPQFHFSPEANWMNDPNGMYYYEGQYHLFYQYYPDSTVWGPMHWAHARSKDMVHWENLPIALYPDSLGYIFSGGAVVDNQNTSNLGTAEQPPIIASFTHHNMDGERAKTNEFQTQSIAYSNDGGSSWTKYKNNPVIPNSEKIKDFRDPKVVWHEASQKWILVLAAYDKAKFYSSPNMIDWTFISDFGIEGDQRLWECPDLFPMKVNDTDQEKWVLISSIQKQAPNGGTATSYFVGDFDGQNFIADTADQQWLDWGTDNYAFVTWNNVPQSDGRILGLGWMSNWQYAQIVPTEKWRSAMTLPRELQLVQSDSKYKLLSKPVQELQQLRSQAKTLTAITVTDEMAIDAEINPAQAELIFDINLEESSASMFGFNLKNKLGEFVNVTFDKSTGMMQVDRTQSRKDKFSDKFFSQVHTAPIDFSRQTLELQVFLDASSIEIFVNNGELCFTEIFFPSEDFDQLSLFAKEGSCSITSAELYNLKSIW